MSKPVLTCSQNRVFVVLVQNNWTDSEQQTLHLEALAEMGPTEANMSSVYHEQTAEERSNAV